MYLSDEKLNKINKKHAKLIKGYMTTALSNGFHEKAEERPPLENELAMAMWDSDEDEERDQLLDMLAMEGNQERKELSMEDVMRSADAQHNAVLKKPWYVSEKSNRDEVLAQYILQNIDEMITKVPVRCRDFQLLPEQRIAILAMTSPMTTETYTELEITRDSMKELTADRARKQPFKVSYNIEAGALPVFTVADYCTGSGKTVMALMAALMLLCDPERWAALKRDYKDILRARIRDNYSGLCKGEAVSKGKLARLAVVFVPANMLTHWYRTAQSAVFGCKDVYGGSLDVVIWKGEAGYRTVRDAYDSGKPTLWILPMEHESMKPMRAFPDIGYAVRIFDELNMPMRTRYDQMESTALFNYVTQATIDAFKSCTVNQPRNPVRLAFGGNYFPISNCKKSMQYKKYSEVQTGLEHFCKMRQFAAPEFLRRLVAKGVRKNMPAGLIVHKLDMRAGTLAALVTGSGMIRMTLPDLAVKELGVGVAGPVKERVRELFSQAELMGSAEILGELDTELEKMPERNLSENAAKMAVRRLRERMNEIFGSKMPECPVSLCPIEPQNVRICSQCTAVLDVDSIAGCNGRCPLCRCYFSLNPSVAVQLPDPEKAKALKKEQPESKATLKYDKSQTTLSPSLRRCAKSTGLPPKEEGGANADAHKDAFSESEDDEYGSTGPSNEGRNEHDPSSVDDPERVQAFEQRLADISARKLYCVEGIIETLKAQVALNPASRILLCFSFEHTNRGPIRELMETMELEIPNAIISDIDILARDWQKADAAKTKYDDAVKYPVPIIFLINTKDRVSSSAQGLDLHATDLTIVADKCKLHMQRQAAGRSLRMRKRPREMAEEDRFPAKRIVVAAIHGGFV